MDNAWENIEAEEELLEEVQDSLREPCKLPYRSQFFPGPFIHLSFDGGSRSGIGTAGFVIADSETGEVER